LGGFSYGFEAAGLSETVAFCEIDEYCHKVLNKHWEGVPIYNDIRRLTAGRLISDGVGDIDIITGGFPCQDISVAGQQKGISKETRSGLWHELIRVVGEIRPRYAVFENVTALLSGDDGGWMRQVLWDISQIGYDAEWECISASQVGAPHIRDRIWIFSYPKILGVQGQWSGGEQESQTHARPILSLCDGKRSDQASWDAEPAVCGVDDGLPDGIYQGRTAVGIKDRAARLRCLGNAIVPQIAMLIAECIKEKENVSC
jgi:DNA (cytosine-5)-methyltransferase 1